MASFFCIAEGNPRPQIEWRKGGKRLVTQRYTVLDMPPNGSVLRIEPVKADRDNATYECLAENGVGEPERAMATLSVIKGWFGFYLICTSWRSLFTILFPLLSQRMRSHLDFHDLNCSPTCKESREGEMH